MRFEVTDEAAALRDAAASLLSGEVTPEVVRAGWPGGDVALVDAAWRKLAGVGVIGTLVSEDAGGLGLDENCLVPLLVELGRSGLPVPAVETIAVAAPLLVDDPRLPAVLAGELTVAARLDGSELVPFGARAGLVVLRDGDALRAYEPGELTLEPVPTVDGSRAMARVTGRRGPGRELAGDAETAWRRGVLGTSALLVGLSRRMLELTVEYVKGREQYGVAIGSFQAIKHMLANALVAVEFAAPVALAAGWSQASGAPDAADRTSAAKVLASDAARLVARTAIQCHGAMGYTTEYDLHLFAKRAWALAPSWGDPARHRAELAVSLGVANV